MVTQSKQSPIHHRDHADSNSDGGNSIKNHNCKQKQMRMKSSASGERISVSRHQLRRNPKAFHDPKHRHHTEKPKSPLCTSFQNLQSSSSVLRSTRSLPNDMKRSSHATVASSILIVKTQNESLRSFYGSTEYLNTASRSLYSSRGSLSSNKSLIGDTGGDTLLSTASSGSLSNVSFDKVCVREYPRCIGDNVPSSGPPIGIDWEHQTHEEMPIDEYERVRPMERKRSGGDLRMTPSVRVAMLEHEWQATHSEIMRASLESSSIRERRIKTIQRTRNAERVEEIMESARHSLKKVSLKRVFSSSKKDKSSRNVKFKGI